MARVLALLGGIGCLGIAGAAGYQALVSEAAPSVNPPKPTGLVVEEPMHDFGTVGQMETLRAEFKLTNHFPAAVTVKDVIKSCSCAEVAITPERLEPGQSATLMIGWRTGGRRGQSSDLVTVLAQPDGEPGTVGVQVRLKAHVEPDLLCDRDEVRFERKQVGTVILHFTPGRMADGRIRSAHPSTMALTTTIDPIAGTVTVQFDPAMLDGDEPAAVVTVQTTSPKEPWVTIPVALTGAQ